VTTPLSGEQLAEIRTEVNRLRAESDAAQRAYVFDTAALKRENGQLRALIGDFTDPDRCHYDVYGNCTAHDWPRVEPRCPHARAKDLPPTTPACSCGAESVHQAGCDTGRPVNPHADHDGNPDADAMWHEQHDDTETAPDPDTD